MKLGPLVCYLFLFGLIKSQLMAQVDIVVNQSDIIATGISEKYGINLNAGVDSDVDRAPGAQLLSDALIEMGVKRLRYPGGKKTNFFAWTADPLNPDPTSNYWTSYPANRAQTTMNFDEFMALCNQTGAKPHVNVAVNPWNTTLYTETLAAEWVRYANITKGYGVEYWEIGNEMWHSDYNYTFAEIVEIVNRYSNAMKAVDPTIKVGVSWKGGAGESPQDLIDTCGSALDFICISNYVNGGGNHYSDYLNGTNVDLLNVNESLSLNTVISEFNRSDWTKSSWDLANSTGKGLINFDLIGQILKSSKTEYGMLWNTRWYPDINTGIYSDNLWHAVDNSNSILPVAKSFALWEKFIGDSMVNITSNDGGVVVYATVSESGGKLNVFVLNKKTSSESVSINIPSFQYDQSEVWQFSGVDEWDESPTITSLGSVSGSPIAYTVPSTSITVFSLTGTTISDGNLVNNSGFETGDLAHWSGTGSHGVTTNGSYTGTYSGWCGSTNSSLFQTLSGLTPNTSYVFSCYVYNWSGDGGAVTVGVENCGGFDVSRSISHSAPEWIPVQFEFRTGSSNTTADIYMSTSDADTWGRVDNVIVEANVVGNFDFETGDVAPWSGTGSHGVTSNGSHTGSYSGWCGGTNSSLFQTLSGLTPNTSYVFSCHVYNWSGDGGAVTVGVENFGGPDVSQSISHSAPEWVFVQLPFTTGGSNTTADIYMSTSDADTWGRMDDIAIAPNLNPPQVAVTLRAQMINGQSDSLSLVIGGQTVETWTVSGSSYSDYTTTINAGFHDIKLYFADNGTDMRVDYLQVGNDTYQTEAQPVNECTWQGGSCGGSYNESLHCSGYVEFGIINAQ
ncbi:MAG: carbohydrate binding domain-containing protein [Opitutales bacterium]|nr:carbohydrate binding domain-containing protein [Opitutales bacterium]